MTGNEVLKKQLRDILESLGEEPTQIVAAKVHILLLTSHLPDILTSSTMSLFHHIFTLTLAFYPTLTFVFFVSDLFLVRLDGSVQDGGGS